MPSKAAAAAPQQQTVQEGARWRYVRPTADEVAAWFKDVPLDEGMDNSDWVSGIVVIPATEKVKYQTPDGKGTEERFEMTFTPYMRVDTRIAYFRRLAKKDNLVAVIEPVDVPQTTEGSARNSNMAPGFWWHVTAIGSDTYRFVCCTMRVALYQKEAWYAAEDSSLLRAVREGIATKAVNEVAWGKVDPSAVMKAETGAIGRALGMAGILVIGTGIATAEDMQDAHDAPEAAPSLPESVPGEETEARLNETLVNLESTLRAYPDARQQFIDWWKDRSKEEGWSKLNDAPIEVRRGMKTKLEDLLAAAREEQQDLSSTKDEEAEGV